MNKLFKRTLPIAMVAALSLSLTACANGNAYEGSAAFINSISVETITPGIGNIVVIGEYIGTVEPNQQVTVFPRVPGEVRNVYFGVGDTVSAGDVLFTIDAVDIINNISSLEAQLAIQDAAVRSAQTGVSLADGSAMQSQILTADGGVNQAEFAISQAEQGLEQARMGIEQAQTAYDVAHGAYRDTTALFDAGAASRVALEQAEMAYLNAQVGLERAQSGYASATIALAQARQAREQALEGQRIVTEEAPTENRRRAQDALGQAQATRNSTVASLQIARDRLDDATVRAPIGGVIEARHVEQFNMAAPGAPAFVIAAKDGMTVTFRVPRSSAAHLELGDSVTLNIGNSDYPGTISEIATAVDASGLLTIKASIPNPPANLLSGVSVRIFADAGRAENVMVVPLDVIHYDRGVPYVFIAENGAARRTQVEVGIFDTNYIQIIYGVSTHDQIISTWSARLADGVEIEVVSLGRGE